MRTRLLGGVGGGRVILPPTRSCGLAWERHSTPDGHVLFVSVTENERSLEDLRCRSHARNLNICVRLELPTVGPLDADMLLSVEAVSVQRKEWIEDQPSSLDEEGVGDGKLKWSAHDAAAAELFV